MVKCGKYNARMLREPVTFQSKTLTADGAGGFTEAWSTITNSPTRALVTQSKGSEAYSHNRIEGRAGVRVVTRYNSAINEGHAVLIRGIRYNIRSVNNVDFDDDWLEIDAERGVAV